MRDTELKGLESSGARRCFIHFQHEGRRIGKTIDGTGGGKPFCADALRHHAEGRSLGLQAGEQQPLCQNSPPPRDQTRTVPPARGGPQYCSCSGAPSIKTSLAYRCRADASPDRLRQERDHHSRIDEASVIALASFQGLKMNSSVHTSPSDRMPPPRCCLPGSRTASKGTSFADARDARADDDHI